MLYTVLNFKHKEIKIYEKKKNCYMFENENENEKKNKKKF
jgi:hypothetical protein